MKKMMTAVMLIFSITTLTAQSSKLITTETTEVTVFMNGAQITEETTVQLKEGENQFKVSELPLYMDPNSVQVEGNPNYTILSVRHQVNYLVDANSSPKIKALKDSLEDALFKQQEFNALRQVVMQEKMLLEANRDIKSENAVLVPEDVEDMANFFKKRFTEIEYRLLELSEKDKKNNAEIIRLQNQLNNLNARKGTNPSEVLITLMAKKAGSTSLKFNYFTQSAGWYPVYDLRADDINTPIEFSYRAKVYQSTGKDWEDVNLTISTGNPTVGGQVPTLYPWYLNIYDPRPVSYGRAGAKAEMYKDAAPAAAYDNSIATGFLQEETAAGYTQLQSNAVNTEFKISIPYDIPSDNQQYDVTMQQQTLKASYAYVTIPKLDNDAFLRAQITDWAQYSLLPGESNIFFKGTFVGKGYIDPALANDTLNLSLGRDKSVVVKRDQIKEFSKTGVFGGKQQTTKAFDITVQNNKKQSITIIIEDQLPISQNSDITVEAEELSGGAYDAQTGKVVWNATLAPGETWKKQLRFVVKYPKKKYLTGL